MDVGWCLSNSDEGDYRRGMKKEKVGKEFDRAANHIWETSCKIVHDVNRPQYFDKASNIPDS
jgi:hypothetical protein